MAKVAASPSIIARAAAVDAYRREALTVGAAVDVDVASLIVREPVQYRAQLVNRVVAQPRSRRVGARSVRVDHGAQRALTAGLDVAGGRLAKDGHIGGQPVRQLTLDAAQTV
ncbi:hypothetical protein A5707_21080 [Mycobacterium kyorinense]|uniref:Uncharacterized protein n=1 Tax=Mycobacterium kyorinense TaxID=487514 RepID=A0A1A2ZAQ2_9MYCO|nr:hypothetical protein A5707_21080 [Mycobacterium kyorinense]